MTPTKRSLDLLRREGFIPAVVERWNMFAGPPEERCRECGKNKIGVRQDLWGFADIIAINPTTKTVLLVQTTSGSNLAARRKKLARIGEVLLCMAAGFKIEIHGWSKRANGRYEVNREVLN